MPVPLDDILACVCTYNEAANIRDCLAAIREAGVRHVLVVDGGSSDETAALARQAGAEVLASPKGLSSQRQAAIQACAKPYLMFVDADDRLDRDCPATLLTQVRGEGYDALQACLRVFEPKTYCQRGMDALLRFCICRPGESRMVGRPALYRLAALRAAGMDTRFDGVGNEDAALSIRMERAGFRQGVGRGLSFRRHPATFAENRAAWRKYGAGDAHLIRLYPHKAFSVLAHLLFNYPVRRSLTLALHGAVLLAGYPVCVGLARFAAMCRHLFAPAPTRPA